MLMSTKCQENEKKMTTNVMMIGYDMIFMIFFIVSKHDFDDQFFFFSRQ
jgi:hypothetical protein